MKVTRDWVLVVDDDAAFREMMADALEVFGHPALAAASAAEAMGVVETLTTAPRCLVTDVVMPGIGGLEIARELASRVPDLGVVFVSGYPEDIIAGHGLSPDRVAFLRKPFDLDRLEEALVRLRARPAGGTGSIVESGALHR